jgi:hypothetical protein
MSLQPTVPRAAVAVYLLLLQLNLETAAELAPPGVAALLVGDASSSFW